MAPKEKAHELYNQFYGIPLYIKTVKQCCLIAVNQIISAIGLSVTDEYWQEVKQEIEKL